MWDPLGPTSLGLAVPAVGTDSLAIGGTIPAWRFEAISGPVRAVAAFLLVLAIGGILLSVRAEFVDRSIDLSMDRPVASLLYGIIAYVLMGFLGGIAILQTTQLGMGTQLLITVGLVVVALALLVVGSLGYVVLGTGVTELFGERNPWNGLVFGAAIGAVGWIVFPGLVAGAVWLVGAAAGIGGPMRAWMHAHKGIPPDKNR